MNFEFSASQAALAVILIAVLVIAIIFVTKYVLNHKKGLKEKYEDKKVASPLIARNKYPEVDAFKQRSSILLFGLLASLALVFIVFNWTTYEKTMDYSSFDLTMDDEIEIDIPRTAEPPPPPPPPPPPVIEAVDDDVILDEDPPEIDAEVDVDDVVVDIPVDTTKKAAPPPPPPPPKPKKEEIFKIVEQMPRFPGCEDKATKKEKTECASAKLYEYIYSKLKYPTIAQENGIEGKVYLRFAVNKEGKVSQVTILRDIGGNCGEAAAKVIREMGKTKKWIPGRQGGRKVSVWFTLPIVFKLTG